ncbi:hypothetical protein CTI12_AA485620 [Artemisia annua]|uniref:IQ motif, EF-hand binding site n=1 Tax=Artemisia annua TaxID=35608 RepID=A0A2U1LJ48_ARTAN|nr:hypothetical protein CTI12_AA485620 [Artemisia annua]
MAHVLCVYIHVWFKALFGLKKERKQSDSGERKNNPSCIPRSPRGYPASSPDDTPLIKPSYGRELNRRAIDVVVASTHAANVAFVAAQAAVKYVEFTSENLNISAAITIQTMFRGYLVRKALKALKSLMKLQAYVRGYLVRKGATETCQGMEAMLKVRSRACSQRSRLQDDKYSRRSIVYVERRAGSDSVRTGPYTVKVCQNLKVEEGLLLTKVYYLDRRLVNSQMISIVLGMLMLGGG